MLKKFLLLAALAQTQTPTIDRIIQELQSLKDAITKPVINEVSVSTAVGLQIALDSEAPIIRVLPGTYVGNFVLKNKTTKTIIKGIEFEGRARPDYTYPKLVALDKFVSVLKTLESAHDYTFIGLEFTGVNPDRNVIEIGARSETLVEQLPHDITFDKVYIHGTNFGHRGILFDAVNGTIINSHCSEFLEQNRDSNCIGIFNGKGPYLIDNNYFSASGEGMIVGGADPTISNLIPSDLTITNNTFFKPLEWKNFPGSVKNAFELKNANNVVIKNNVFENVWAGAQSGSGVLFTVRNQNGKCPWCNITNVEFSCNIIKGVSNYGISILGTDNNSPSGVAENIKILSNLIFAGGGIQIDGGPRLVEVENNVILGVKSAFLAFVGGQSFGFRFTGNSVTPGNYGVSGTNTGQGIIALEAFALNYYFKLNRIETTTARTIRYPLENTLVPPGTIKESDLIPCK